MLVNICEFLAVRGVWGVAVMGVKARKVPLTEARGHWEQRAAGDLWCWCFQQLAPTTSAAVRETQAQTDQQHPNGWTWSRLWFKGVLFKVCLPCHSHLWTLLTCTEQAVATETVRELDPEGMNPGPVGPGNRPAFPSCKNRWKQDKMMTYAAYDYFQM